MNIFNKTKDIEIFKIKNEGVCVCVLVKQFDHFHFLC